jgi:hypothetical protein
LKINDLLTICLILGRQKIEIRDISGQNDRRRRFEYGLKAQAPFRACGAYMPNLSCLFLDFSQLSFKYPLNNAILWGEMLCNQNNLRTFAPS